MLLAYSDVRLTSPLGRIFNDAPEVHVRAEFKATHFSPRVGDHVDATVSRIGSDHISLLVLGMFNASVAHQDGAPPTTVQPDEKVVFIVRSITHTNGLLSMHGELANPGTYRPYSAEPKRNQARVARPSGGSSGASQQARTTTGVVSQLSESRPRHSSDREEPAVASTTAPAGDARPKRSKEEREEKRKRKAARAEARAASTAAAPEDNDIASPPALVPVPVQEHGHKRARDTEGDEASAKPKRSKEEREEKRKRKAARAEARAAAASLGA